MSSARFVSRPLESGLFGQPIYAAQATSVSEIDALLEEAPSLERGLIVVRLPSHALAAAQRLEESGGRLCDILLTMSCQLHAGDVVSCPSLPDVVVRHGRALDAAGLHALGERAFEGFVGHWHLDDRLPAHLADKLYAQWAADLARAASDGRPLFVAETLDGDVAGFLALACLGDRRWHVPLTAVDPVHRGRGVVRALLATAMAELAARGELHLDYETQLSNRAALRSVARCGLAPSTSRLTFHLWTSPQ